MANRKAVTRTAATAVMIKASTASMASRKVFTIPKARFIEVVKSSANVNARVATDPPKAKPKATRLIEANAHTAGSPKAKAKAGKPPQLDLFIAMIGDVPLRDDREGMSVPMVSLSKGKRTKPIEWKSSNGDRYVRVTANATYGMATIWDLDVLIWAVSQLNEMVERKLEIGPMILFQPYDLLRAICRGVGGKDYAELEAALNRLAGTLVETNIRTIGNQRKSTFHLLERWDHETDEVTGRSKGMSLVLPRWIYEGVVKQRDVLAMPQAYFHLSSGIARSLYRLARRHAGVQPAGWRFTMGNLHARSGSVQPLNQFAKGVRKVVEAQGVPEYRLDIVHERQGEEVVMVRDPASPSPPDGCSGDGHGGSSPNRHGGSHPRPQGNPLKTKGNRRP